MRTPIYLLRALVSHAGTVEARRALADASAAAVPHMRAGDRRRYLDQLQMQAAGPRPPVPPMPKERLDPDAAAAWFAARGVRTVKAG